MDAKQGFQGMMFVHVANPRIRYFLGYYFWLTQRQTQISSAINCLNAFGYHRAQKHASPTTRHPRHRGSFTAVIFQGAV